MFNEKVPKKKEEDALALLETAIENVYNAMRLTRHSTVIDHLGNALAYVRQAEKNLESLLEHL